MWNEELTNLKARSIEAFRMRKNCDRPRTGIIYQGKCQSKLEYKRDIKDAKKCSDKGINRKLRFWPKKVKIVKNSGINGCRLWKEQKIIIKILIKILEVLITWKKHVLVLRIILQNILLTLMIMLI